MSLSAIPKLLRAQVFERDGGRCRYCRLAQLGQVAVFHINHIIPRSKGGATTLANLVLQCPYCSLHKSDKLTGKDPRRAAFTRYSNRCWKNGKIISGWTREDNVREFLRRVGQRSMHYA